MVKRNLIMFLSTLLVMFTPGSCFLPTRHRDAMFLQLAAVADFELTKPDGAAERIQMPWDVHRSPLHGEASCPPKAGVKGVESAAADTDAVSDRADANLKKAFSVFCAANLKELAQFYLDQKFASNHKRLADSDGWINKAVVSYVGLKSADDKIAKEMDLLIQSVHHFSELPIVVVNFGDIVPSAWTPDRFPRLVLMHARSVPEVISEGEDGPMSFNFNKLTSMLFTKVKTGVVLDADQWANYGLDYLLDRAAEETTVEYPYPIMPVHWMSRDPESSDMQGGTSWPPEYAYQFHDKKAPKRTMRWGHAHPTWTHHSLPFLAEWTSYALAPGKTKAPDWLGYQGYLEDEDLLNMASWAKKATKQWCKFDIVSPSDFSAYIEQSAEGSNLVPSVDSKWFPNGIAYVFFTAHDAKKPNESLRFLRRLWEPRHRRKAIFFDGKWFANATELRAYAPELKCLA